MAKCAQMSAANIFKNIKAYCLFSVLSIIQVRNISLFLPPGGPYNGGQAGSVVRFCGWEPVGADPGVRPVFRAHTRLRPYRYIGGTGSTGVPPVRHRQDACAPGTGGWGGDVGRRGKGQGPGSTGFQPVGFPLPTTNFSGQFQSPVGRASVPAGTLGGQGLPPYQNMAA
jgi:hypothetical protein